MRKILPALALFILCISARAADKYSTVHFLVVRDYNGKPVRAAAVVMHPLDDKGRQKSQGMELKTSAEGRTEHPAVPYGKMRVQVIAPGLQTYGEDYLIDQPEMEITIQLKRPQEQHSIYK